MDPQKTLTARLEVRVSEKEKEGFEAAAQLHDIPVSSWIRDRLQAAAKRELKQRGERIPFATS